MGMKVVYIANVLVAGWIGITSLFFPKQAGMQIFSNAYPTTDVIRLVGALWLAIAVVSGLGLWKATALSPVLLIQLIYKGTWLLVVALPALRNGNTFPKGMAFFFLVWVCLLPFVIPWKALLREGLLSRCLRIITKHLIYACICSYRLCCWPAPNGKYFLRWA